MRWRDAQTVKHNLRLGDAMKVKLYYLEISHPSNAACLMLDHKGLEYERVDLRPGLQPLVTRLRGFPGITVPALQLDGRRIQGSVPIAHALEELVPEPPLYPPDNKLRAAVRNAEEWCERELQGGTNGLCRRLWTIKQETEGPRQEDAHLTTGDRGGRAVLEGIAATAGGDAASVQILDPPRECRRALHVGEHPRARRRRVVTTLQGPE